MPSSMRAATLLLVLFTLGACGASTSSGRTARPVGTSHATIEELSYRLDGLANDDPRRAALRSELVTRVAAASDQASSLEALERSLGTIVRHYRPNELETVALPAEVVALAERLLAAATARGDSADALSALCLLRLARPTDPELQQQQTRIVQWVESGNTPSDEADPGAIIGAFQDAVGDARVLAVPLCPTPSALAEADRVLVEAARMVVDRPEPRLRQIKARIRLTVVLTVAAVHLIAGDEHGIDRALPREVAPSESAAFEDLLSEALAPSNRGADGLLELGDAVARIGGEPLVGVLRIGRRIHPQDPRFALALAHVERERGEALAALVAYVDAAELSVGTSTYELALRELLELGQALVADEDPRAIPVADALERLRADFARRSPERAAELPTDRFMQVEASAALLSGDSARAMQALGNARSVEAKIQLALAYLETDRTAEALATLDALLPEGGTPSPEAARERGRILRVRGDVLRAMGRTADAGEAYRSAAFAIREGNATSARARIELALALARSGRKDAAEDVFADLFDDDPTSKEAYVALVELAVSMELSAEVLDESIHHAIVHESLRPERLVLLAALVRLSSTASDDELGAVRMALHRGSAPDGFTSAMAGFTLGTSDAGTLLAAASTPGRRTSAHLLIALAKKRAGDETGYREELQAAVAVGAFDEPAHSMARELILGLPSVD